MKKFLAAIGRYLSPLPRVQVVRLMPGDMIVLESDSNLGPERVARLKMAAAHTFNVLPGQIVVIDGGLTFRTIIRPTRWPFK